MRRHRLASGATVLLEADSGAIAALRVVGLGGQLGEHRASAGRAAMWARTVARGAGGLGASAYGRALSGLGGSVGGLSGRSSQALRAEFPAESFGPGLELLLHALTEPAFLGDEVEQARAALLDDLAARDDDPGERLAVAAWAAACAGHPWGLDPAGTPASLARLGRRDLMALHRGWARPENLVFSVVGDVDAEAVLARLEAATARLSNGPLAANVVPLNWAAAPTRRVQLRSERDQAHLVGLWPGLAAGDARAAALDVLIELLGGQSGRLFLELREAEGLAYAVGAESTEGVIGGLVSCAMACDPGRLDEAERSLLASIHRVARGEFTDEEVERARASVLGSVEVDLQTAGSRASEAAFAERYGLDGRGYRRLLRRAAEVTRADVAALAATLFATPRVIGRLAPR
jgi:zinc protease